MRIDADSVLTLRMNAPHWVDDRAALCGSTLIHFDPVGGLLQFHTSCEASRNIWIQTIDYVEWDTIVPEELRNENPPWDRVKADVPDLMNVDVRVHCNCPAFRYWGAWFNTKVRDSAIFDDSDISAPVRWPHIQPSNMICKHLSAVFGQHF